MARKRRHTRLLTEIIESSDRVYSGNAIVIFQSRTAAGTLYILTKEQHPRLVAHSMADGLIFWHKAESDGNTRRPYRRTQDDILFWQNFDQECIKAFLRRTCQFLQVDVLAQEIYHGCNSVRSPGAHRANK